MKQASFVLKGDLCWSEAPEVVRTLPGGYVVCEDGICTGVFEVLPQRYHDLPLADYTGRLVTPGLTDLHVHA
ncbi:MAG: guanine deaminase, partial [Ruthenibacterium sp.]